ncbi:hypothetical protein ACSQ67_015980 [Phaseolus vulgaris]
MMEKALFLTTNLPRQVPWPRQLRQSVPAALPRRRRRQVQDGRRRHGAPHRARDRRHAPPPEPPKHPQNPRGPRYKDQNLPRRRLRRHGELFSKLSLARRYFSRVVSVLLFFHRHGIAHRDLKPQNLLLDAAGDLKVSDFGLSAIPEHLGDDLLHTACGTPAFTAPEILRRVGYDGCKGDA